MPDLREHLRVRLRQRELLVAVRLGARPIGVLGELQLEALLRDVGDAGAVLGDAIDRLRLRAAAVSCEKLLNGT